MERKKLIFIILGSGLLVFLLIYGVSIYHQEKDIFLSYEEKIDEIMRPAQIESESCFTEELNSGYRICCAITGGIKEGLFYDCTSQAYLEPNQLVRIIFNPSKFDFDYNPYLLTMYSDLHDEEGNKIQKGFPATLNKEKPNILIINGTVPQDQELFTLLNLKVYPDVPFFEAGDEKTILNLQAQVIKE